MSSDTPGDWEVRVTDHLNNIESRNEEYQFPTRIYGTRNAQSGGGFSMFMGRDVILEQRPHDLSLDQLQRLPEFLCDLSLRSENSEICGDHFQFWAWTGALASSAYVHVNTTFNQDALADLCVLIQLALFTYRDSNYSDQGPYWNNPSYLTVLIENYNIATLCGYPLLEGLLRRRCKETKSDGSVVQGHESVFDQYDNGSGRIYLAEAFDLWRDENDPKAPVEDSLDAIDDLDQDLKQALDTKFQNVPFSPLVDSGVLHFLKELRNINLHGEAHTQAIASVIVTLSCLVFLDTLDQSGYDAIVGGLDSELKEDREDLKQVYGYFPSGFYPLNKDAWREPDEDSYNMLQTPDGILVRFGKDAGFDVFTSVAVQFFKSKNEPYFNPKELRFYIETPEGEQEKVGDLTVLSDVKELVILAQQMVEGEYQDMTLSRPRQLLIGMSREPRTNSE